MFTGIVQDLGVLTRIEDRDGLRTLHVKTRLPRSLWPLGASVAVHGVCLTVEKRFFWSRTFQVSVVAETLNKTVLGKMKAGDRVHLEPSLRANDLLSGHWVSGHVDGLCTVLQPAPELVVKVPSSLLPMLSYKGSVALNGVSLTVADLQGDQLKVALIPETLERTLFSLLRPDDLVHIEVDPMARILYRFYENSHR